MRGWRALARRGEVLIPAVVEDAASLNVTASLCQHLKAELAEYLEDLASGKNP